MRFLLIALAVIVSSVAAQTEVGGDGNGDGCNFVDICAASSVGHTVCCGATTILVCQANLTVTASPCPIGQACQTSSDGKSAKCA
jgi:hypothetical protein